MALDKYGRNPVMREKQERRKADKTAAYNDN
jgi:hypothetical protein